MIKIYGSAKSSAGRCFWCLEEIGIDYEVQGVNFREKEHKSANYLKLNPNGKVPVMTDGDFAIWESMAINLYLAESYKPELLGKNLKEKALIQQWSVWAIAEVQPPLIEAFIQLVFVPEERRSMEVIEKAKAKMPAMLGVLNDALTQTGYLVGNEFTLADLNVASVVTITEAVGIELTEYKNILAWLKGISDRPAFQRYQEISKN